MVKSSQRAQLCGASGPDGALLDMPQRKRWRRKSVQPKRQPRLPFGCERGAIPVIALCDASIRAPSSQCRARPWFQGQEQPEPQRRQVSESLGRHGN